MDDMFNLLYTTVRIKKRFMMKPILRAKYIPFFKRNVRSTFDDVQLHQKTTMLEGCHDCTYHAIVTN
ncbi:hypothetical protein AWH49_09350 [Domibacillus aminovorans]|uniref:Uncharacterized protein n=1 Tax=Domibacillus aminovorans TaxID=29332 RepID=A0A177LAW4_9BACI|nr:hypothetical protein AWH49_09350 [Domibacillus aminovorans]